MTMLAQEGNRVFFLENLNPSPVLNLSILPKAGKRLARMFFKRNNDGSKQVPNIIVVTPFVIPFKNKIAQFINRNILLGFILFYLKLKGVKNPVVWTYLATSLALKLIDELKPETLIYDCVTEAIFHPGFPKDINKTERKLIESADLIFTDNHHLFKKCKETNINTYIIPPGCDFQQFSNAPVNKDADLYLDKIRHPMIGYFGGVEELVVDIDLIAYIAKEKPDWNLLIFGPVRNTNTSILKQKNIILGGPVAHKDLPSYLEKLDVLILPYKIKEFTKSIFPAKIFECLATGKPVVSTPLEELLSFEDGVIYIAKTKEEFVQTIEKALNSDTPINKQKRLEIAAKNSWEQRFDEIKTIIKKY
jgi:glycosyltransferase involved in cell wall biosynthesis